MLICSPALDSPSIVPHTATSRLLSYFYCSRALSILLCLSPSPFLSPRCLSFSDFLRHLAIGCQVHNLSILDVLHYNTIQTLILTPHNFRLLLEQHTGLAPRCSAQSTASALSEIAFKRNTPVFAIMSVLQHRPVLLGQRHGLSPQDAIDSNDTSKEHIFIVGNDGERPQQEMDFPTAKLVSLSDQRSKNNLRINTYSKTELHDRYMSSEEEPSLGPDSEESHDEELKHKSSSRLEDAAELPTATDCKAEIAIAVPILALGRPKLVDITNIAPMHKRKQRVPRSQNPRAALKHHSSRLPIATKEDTPFPANEAAEVLTSAPESNALLTRKKSQSAFTAPSSWLPDDEAAPSEDENSFPRLDIRRTPSYHDYDPYSLEPPRLIAAQKGSVSRAKGNLGPSQANHHASGWKGLTRTLSLAKKQHSHHQVTKKPKMVARGANEREHSLILPRFPFREADAAA